MPAAESIRTGRLLVKLTVAGVLAAAGCADSATETASDASTAAVSPAESRPSGSNAEAGGSTAGGTDAVASSEPTFYKPVTLGAGSPGSASETPGENAGGSEPDGPPPSPEEIMEGLKPIATVLVGEWTSILKNASTNEPHQWFWDVKSDPAQPAIVLRIPDGQYFTEARISYLPRSSRFTMTTTDADQTQRKYVGTFDEPPRDVPSDDGKSVERTFKLAFVEQDGAETREKFRYVISQQNNNRYLMEIHRARGSAAFRLRDVAGTQRNGVSFARADDDYGDRTCVISGGLGTSTVSYKGKTYYVCCSGCKAAFEDDPTTWIAKFEAKKKEQK